MDEERISEFVSFFAEDYINKQQEDLWRCVMEQARYIDSIVEPTAVREGAGVIVRRSIAGPSLNYLDPFLLLDHFQSQSREDYEAGFPLHPHRGIETVTYVLDGSVHHKDTLGNSGSIGAGDLQWMTSGRGIMHEEMPQVRPEGISGFQLWVNLPAKLKMSSPGYQDVRSGTIPEVQDQNGAKIRVIAGEYGNVTGPVKGIAADPRYLDFSLPPRSSITQPIPKGHHAFAYLFEGLAFFQAESKGEEAKVSSPKLIVLTNGDFVRVRTGDAAARFLLVSGMPLNEPVARYGPFVMNTREEIEQALEDLRRGTFIRK
jgi:redox-sensitive bicupin YhaK (pirin superfamily)